MGKRYQNNMADQDLIVRSIKVLENIHGGGMKEIRQDIERVRQNTSIQFKQQEEYWKTLSDDGVITPIEKQSLKREMENIRQSFGAVTQQITSFGYTNPIVTDYVNTYNALRGYIYDTLRLFDDMTTETEIGDRETFNEYFSNYFFLESFIILAITKGVLDTLQFRVLENLQEEGTEGETALYHGGLYQYTDGRWKAVSTGNYKGAKDELLAAEEDSFFLASETFVMVDVLIVNGEELEVNGDQLGITHTYLKGYIYYVMDGLWYVEEDKTNWRYAAAFADVLNVTGELPQIFQDGLDALQAQIDTVSGNLSDEIAARQGQYTIINGEIVEINGDIEEIIARADTQQEQINGKVSHLPQYFGGRNTLPENPQEGDWFTWTGGNLDPWYTGKVYKYTNGAWSGALNATDVANRSYFALALVDILSSKAAGEGYFSTVFAEAFFSNSATLDNLAVKTIYLRGDGNIQSDKLYYTYQRVGTQIKSNGDIDANGDTHIAGKVAIGVDLKNEQGQYQPDFNTYNVVIGGNTKITGNINATSGTFNGTVNASGGTFTGTEKINGELRVNGVLTSSGFLYHNGNYFIEKTSLYLSQENSRVRYYDRYLLRDLFFEVDEFRTKIERDRARIPYIASMVSLTANIKGHVYIQYQNNYGETFTLQGELINIHYPLENGSIVDDKILFNFYANNTTDYYRIIIYRASENILGLWRIYPNGPSFDINASSSFIAYTSNFKMLVNY